jgi:hypothetical protein
VAVATDGEAGKSPVPCLDLNDPEAVARFVVGLMEREGVARAADRPDNAS